jgi:antitoxin component of MazEF toxin-antitoxin module
MAVPYVYKHKCQKIHESFFIAIPAIWVKANGITKGQKLTIEAYADKLIVTK